MPGTMYLERKDTKEREYAKENRKKEEARWIKNERRDRERVEVGIQF